MGVPLVGASGELWHRPISQRVWLLALLVPGANWDVLPGGCHLLVMERGNVSIELRSPFRTWIGLRSHLRRDRVHRVSPESEWAHGLSWPETSLQLDPGRLNHRIQHRLFP